MTDPRLPHLFSPLRIKGLELKNRLVMACVNARMGSFSGKVTDTLRSFYSEVARGGVGMIILPLAACSPEGRRGLYTLGLWDDKFIPGLRDLAADVHAAGARAAVQVSHAGASADPAHTGTRGVAPSFIPNRGGEIPRALPVGEIGRIVEDFAQAARRARDAGMDMVEFQGAHGYLVNQFLSPLWNQREDQYGGSLENRARFLVEIVRRTREVVGDEFPIIVRLGADDFVPGGFTLSDGLRVARMVEEAGADVLNVSGGIGETFAQMIPSSLTPAGNLVHLAAAVRQEVRIPVMAVGRLHEPALAESVLAEGKADLIAMGRALIADPYWPKKAAEGRWEEIRSCLSCLSPGCFRRTLPQMDLGCQVNPTVGRERMFDTTPVANPKRVMVVGGGPAGVEAAVAAARRGHEVTLYERGSELGGQIPLAAAPPHKDETKRYLQYLRATVAKSAVKVVLGTEVTPELVEQQGPDVVIVATGATPMVLNVPIREQETATAWEILGGQVEAGENVVVVGGGVVGCETAAFLVARDKRVTILEMLPAVAGDVVWWHRNTLLQQLADADVEILNNAKLVRADRGTVTYDRGGMAKQIRGVDTLVFATGAVPQDSLSSALREKAVDVRVVGDCVKAGRLGDAVQQGFEAGITIE